MTGAGGGSVVVVGGMYGTVVVGVVTGGASGAGGAGHITAVPNRLHWLISFARQRLNLPSLVIQPHVCVIAVPHSATHCALVDTGRASAKLPTARTAVSVLMMMNCFTLKSLSIAHPRCR